MSYWHSWKSVPIHLGHVNVHERDVGLEFAGLANGFAAVSGFADDFHLFVAGEAEADALAHDRMVIDAPEIVETKRVTRQQASGSSKSQLLDLLGKVEASTGGETARVTRRSSRNAEDGAVSPKKKRLRVMDSSDEDDSEAAKEAAAAVAASDSDSEPGFRGFTADEARPGNKQRLIPAYKVKLLQRNFQATTRGTVTSLKCF